MSVVRGWRVKGAFIGWDESVAFVLSIAGGVFWFTGWLSIGFASLARSWPGAANAKTPIAAAKTNNDGAAFSFVKTYFSLIAGI